jgi:hypothetical protein
MGSVIINIIRNKKIRIIYEITVIFIINILTFLLSINGILSNENILKSFIIFVIGVLLFIYSIIYIIKNKSINYFYSLSAYNILYCRNILWTNTT